MNSELERLPLSEVVTLQRGFDLPASERHSGGVPVVASTGIAGWHDKAMVQPPGVVIGRSGSIGGGLFIDIPFWPLNTTLWVKDYKGCEPRWVYYLLRSIDFGRLNAGSGVPTLNRNHLDAITVWRPRREEQRRITAVLTALDDKIEHDHRVMARLLEMVRSQADHLLRTAAGESHPLSFVARFVNGGAFTKLATGSGRPILRIRELNDGVNAATPRTDAVVSDKNLARHNDLLFSWSATLEVYRWFGSESLVNQHIFKVIPNNDYPLWLVEAWIRLHLSSFRVIASDKAVTMGHIRRQDLDEAIVPVPDSRALDEARLRLDALDDLRGALAQERNDLAAIRDELLPRLISGGLRVPESYDPVDVLGTLSEEATASA